jgi:hypothetical protein
MRKPRPPDGVWTANGLKADFRMIRKHPTKGEDIYLVETVAGENWADGKELRWEIKREPKP